MEHLNHNTGSLNVASRVRGNAGSAGLAAALLIFFGFFYVAKPTGSDLFARSALAFVYALRVGGIAMAGLAVWSLLGHRLVLIVDALVSVTIGVVFGLSGVGMLIGGGDVLQVVLNVVFGGMFISAGLRNGRAYSSLTLPAP